MFFYDLGTVPGSTIAFVAIFPNDAFEYKDLGVT
jgi:hypothetical protein